MVKKEYIFNCYLAALKKFSEITDCTCNLKKHKDIKGDAKKFQNVLSIKAEMIDPSVKS